MPPSSPADHRLLLHLEASGFAKMQKADNGHHPYSVFARLFKRTKTL